MQTAEISSPCLTAVSSSSSFPYQTQLLLSQIDSSINKFENLTPTDISAAESLVADFHLHLANLTNLAPFPTSDLILLRKLSYRLSNASIDLSNVSPYHNHDDDRLRIRSVIASLRQVAADLLSLSVHLLGVPLECASFYHRTGLAWHELKQLESALACFKKAMDLLVNVDVDKDPGTARLLFDLPLARAQTAWEAKDFNLAANSLAHAKKYLFGRLENYRALASQYLVFGKYNLRKLEGAGDSQRSKEAMKFMNEALELCDKGFSACTTTTDDSLKALRSKVLRLIACCHLQAGDFESVMKCVKVLRGDGGGDDHPGLCLLAFKALLRLGKYAEAERELNDIVSSSGILEGNWISSFETYYQAAKGAGPQTFESVFLGLLERCQVSAAYAIGVVHRLIADHPGGNLEGSYVRAKLATQLVSVERVVSLFEGDTKVKERTAMHSLLWNCAAGHFRLQHYGVSAEMFKKALLYMPSNRPEVEVLRTIITILNQSEGLELEIFGFIKHARTRISVLGAEYFFRKGETGRCQGSWFAATCWNIGRKIGKSRVLCAEFFVLASEFYGELDGKGDAMSCKSLILAVSAMLASEDAGNCRLTELDVKKASEMLDRAGRLLPSLSSGSGTQYTEAEANIIFEYTRSAYQVYGRLDDAASQKNIVEKFASSPACSPDYLLQIGLIASQSPQTNHEVASFALDKCLSGFLSSDSPDYHKVALVIRKLITIASAEKGQTAADDDDDAVYNLYKRVNQVMMGLEEGKYPSDEGKSLAITAWNRAVLPARLGQFEVALKWMKMGLELANKVSRMELYREIMENNIGRVNGKLQGQMVKKISELGL